jgi:hypothetical protein
MSESIEAFNVWRKEQIASLVRTGHLEAARAFEQLGSIQGSVWDSAWQASRESLVIELPEMEWLHHDEARDAIESHGLKVSQ